MSSTSGEADERVRRARFDRRDRAGGGRPAVPNRCCGRARIHRFPPPEEYSNWTKDAITEVAHDFLTARPGIDRMAQVYVLASDEESLERILHQAIRNHLRSIARATEFGSVMRRVRSVLEDDGRFTLVGGGSSRWTLVVSGARDPYTGPMEFIIGVAWGVKGVRLVRWNSETRRGPYADRESIARICERVLQAFPTAMTVAQLSRAVAARLNVGEPPLVVELDDELAESSNASANDLIADGLVSDEASERDLGLPYGAGKDSRAVHRRERPRSCPSNGNRKVTGCRLDEADSKMIDEDSPDDASRGGRNKAPGHCRCLFPDDLVR